MAAKMLRQPIGWRLPRRSESFGIDTVIDLNDACRFESDAIIPRDGFELERWVVGVVSDQPDETRFEFT